MIFLHPNTETYDPAAGTSLLVNLGVLEGFHDLLDDCTAVMKMHKFADKLFTPAGDLIRGECCCASHRVSARERLRSCMLVFRAGLEDVEAKSHLIVVAEKEPFKVRGMAQPEEDEPPQSSRTSAASDRRAVTPPRAAPSDRTAKAKAPAAAPSPSPSPSLPLALSPARSPAAPIEAPAAPIPEAPAPSATFRKYDLNGDGVLDRDEIINMMRSLGYKTDEAYLENLMEAFASFDDDDSGLIEPNEFEALYAHLVCRHHPPVATYSHRALACPGLRQSAG